MRIAYHRLPTEQRNPRSHHLDQLSPLALLRLMAREDARVLRAVQQALPRIAQAIRLIAGALRDGGRLFLVGAGTSGRLAVLEAAECPPTFSTPPARVQAVIAGGRGAVFRSREGAEDDRAGVQRAMAQRVRRGDVVVGISASGVTPFVDAALRSARRRGAATVLLSAHPRSPIPADVTIALRVGEEVLAGSTRLKAGTATKLVLNMLTLGAMTRLGKTHGNLMVDVRPTSRKLRARAQYLVQTLTGASAPEAAQALRVARGRVKVAVLMRARGDSAARATRRLARAGDSLRRALADGQ